MLARTGVFEVLNAEILHLAHLLHCIVRLVARIGVRAEGNLVTDLLLHRSGDGQIECRVIAGLGLDRIETPALAVLARCRRRLGGLLQPHAGGKFGLFAQPPAPDFAQRQSGPLAHQIPQRHLDAR